MKQIGIIYFFQDSLDFVKNFDEVSTEFYPQVSSTQGFFREDWPGLKQDTVWIVSGDSQDQTKPKYLARLDPNADKATIRQALTYAIAGKFDNLGEDVTRKIYKGGDPSTNGIFEGSAIDLPFPQLGLGNILSFNWIPWWAWAGLGAILALQTLTVKNKALKLLFGAGSAYTGYRAFKKYKSK